MTFGYHVQDGAIQGARRQRGFGIKELVPLDYYNVSYIDYTGFRTLNKCEDLLALPLWDVKVL